MLRKSPSGFIQPVSDQSLFALVTRFLVDFLNHKYSLFVFPCYTHLPCVCPASSPVHALSRRLLRSLAAGVCAVWAGPAGGHQPRHLEAVLGALARRSALVQRHRPNPRPSRQRASQRRRPRLLSNPRRHHGSRQAEGSWKLPGGSGEDQSHVPRHPCRRAAVHEGPPVETRAHRTTDHRARLLQQVSSEQQTKKIEGLSLIQEGARMYSGSTACSQSSQVIGFCFLS